MNKVTPTRSISVVVFDSRSDQTGELDSLDILPQRTVETTNGRIDKNILQQFRDSLTTEQSVRRINFFINLRSGRGKLNDGQSRGYEVRAVRVELAPGKKPSSSSMAASSSIDELIVPCTSSLVPPAKKTVLFPEELSGQQGMIWMIDNNQLERATIWSRRLGKVDHTVVVKQRRLFQSSFAVGSWVSFNVKYDGHGWVTVGELSSIPPKLKFVRYQASDFDVSGEALVVAVFQSYGYLWSDIVGRIKVNDLKLLLKCKPSTAVQFVAKRITSDLQNETDVAFQAVTITPLHNDLAFTDAFITSTSTAVRESQDDQPFSRFTLDAKKIIARPTDCDPSDYLETADMDLFIIYAPALVSEFPFTHRALLVGKLEAAPFDFADGAPIEIEAVADNPHSDRSDDEDSFEQPASSSDNEGGSVADVDENTESDREIANILAKAEEDSASERCSPCALPTPDQPTEDLHSSVPEATFATLSISEPLQHDLSFVSDDPLDATFATACEFPIDYSLELEDGGGFTTACENPIDWSRELEDVDDSLSDSESEIDNAPPSMASMALPGETFFDMLPRRQKAPSESNYSRVVLVEDDEADGGGDQALDLLAHLHHQYEQKMMRLVRGEHQTQLPGASALCAVPVVEHMDAWMVTGPLPLTNLLGVILTDPVLGRIALEGAGIELVMAAADCLTNDLDYDTLCWLAGPDFRDNDDLLHWPHRRNTCTAATQTIPRAELSIFRRLQTIDGFVEAVGERHFDLFHCVLSYEPL